MREEVTKAFTNFARDRLSFTGGLVPKRNGLGKRDFLSQKAWVKVLQVISRLREQNAPMN